MDASEPPGCPPSRVAGHRAAYALATAGELLVAVLTIAIIVGTYMLVVGFFVESMTVVSGVVIGGSAFLLLHAASAVARTWRGKLAAFLVVVALVAGPAILSKLLPRQSFPDELLWLYAAKYCAALLAGALAALAFVCCSHEHASVREPSGYDG